MARGRPKLTMTRRRRQVLDVLREFARDERGMTLGDLVRRCGFYGREDAKRVIRDLKAMGHVE